MMITNTRISRRQGALATLFATTALMLTTGMTSAAHAQTANAQAAANRTAGYDIPAQPLEQALAAWSAASGIRLQSLPQNAERQTSGAVSGNQTAIAALNALLGGTGYTFRFTRVDAIVIEPAAPEAAGSIGTVRVEGTTDIATQGVNGSTDPTATEGSDSYAADQTTVATKIPLSMKETPQSVSVVTQQQLQDRNVTDFQRALIEAPGISTILGGSGGTQAGRSNLQPSFYSRGFLIERLQIDGGAPLSITPNNAGSLVPQINMAAYDHIEILRGADGLLDGQGNPGGVINLTRKRPLDHQQLAFSQLVGSWNNFNTTVDGSTPLTADGNLRARVVLSRQSNDYFYDTARNRQFMVYATLEAQITPSTVIAGGITYTRQDTVPFYNGLLGGIRDGVPYDLNLPRATCFCFDFNRQSFDSRELFARVDQSFGGDWKLSIKGAATRQVSDTYYAAVRGVVGSPDPADAPQLAASFGLDKSTQYTLDGSIGGSFMLFGQKQTVVIGANYSSYDAGGRVQNVNPYRFGGPAVDPFNFNQADYQPYQEGQPDSYTPVQRFTNLGAYGTLRLTPVKPLHLTVGMRYNRYSSHLNTYNVCRSEFGCFDFANDFAFVENGSIYNRFDQSDTTSRFFPAGYLAVGFDVTKTVSVYASKTSIYIDNALLVDANSKGLAPTKGNNWEGGIKYASQDHRLTASVAVFYLRQKGSAMSDPRGPSANPAADPITGKLPDGRNCCFLNDPESERLSKGVDVEIAGELFPGFSVSASYVYNKTTNHSPNIADEPLESQVPEHIYKAWLRYAFRPGSRLKGAYVGLGLEGQSAGSSVSAICSSYLNSEFGGFCTDTTIYSYRLAPRAVVSMQAGYEFSSKLSVALSVNNLLDKKYYASVGLLDGGNWYGTPRNFAITLRGKL